MSENNRLQSISFSPASACIFILLLLLLSASLPLAAASLTYDPAGGKLSGFKVIRDDIIIGNSQDKYHGKDRNVWDNTKGYVGRLLYTGAPTTFTFTNISGPPSTVDRGLLYLVHTTDKNKYREYFLIIRARGRLHNDAHIYIDGAVTTIPKPGNTSGIETYDLTEGAGDELVGNGETGYNDAGVSGTCVIDSNGNYNEFKYRYRCSHIWLDVAMVHTKITHSSWVKPGYFDSSIGVATGTGENLVLMLQGQYRAADSSNQPFNFILQIDKTTTSPLSYNTIKRCTTKYDAVEIATLSYLSLSDPATITIASTSNGKDTNFSFTRSGTKETIPFKLAFKSTDAAGGVVEIEKPNNAFDSSFVRQVSPLGEETLVHSLEGKILLYTIAGTPTPLTGVYSSTIYVLVEQQDT